jgi:hypothetical protein
MGHWLKVCLVIVLLIGGARVVFAQTAGAASEVPTNVPPDTAPTTPSAEALPAAGAAAPAVVATTIPGKKANEPSTLSVVDPPQGRPYELGDTLRLRATGAVATAVLVEWGQPLATRNLALYLHGVEMKALQCSATTGDNYVDLSFHLSRDSTRDENRTAWSSLLTSEEGYVMTFPVSLAIGRQPPLGAKDPDAIHFQVADPTRIQLAQYVATFLFLGIFAIIILNSNLSKILRDADTGYFSLGKTQMVFWGLLVFLAAAAIYSITGCMERIPQQTIALLGISGATSLGATLIGKTKRTAAARELDKVRTDKAPLAQPGAQLSPAEQAQLTLLQGQQQKLETTLQPERPSRGFFRDICDDGNGPSFHRVQVLVWTALLGWAFVQCVASSVAMPEFPESLLLLMGISNGTYLGLKVPE